MKFDDIQNVAPKMLKIFRESGSDNLSKSNKEKYFLMVIEGHKYKRKRKWNDIFQFLNRTSLMDFVTDHKCNQIKRAKYYENRQKDCLH